MKGKPASRVHMKLGLITGGVRSGKSTYAQIRARELGGDNVTYLATAQSLDVEMERRIAQHRVDRPEAWQTVEEPLDLDVAFSQIRNSVVLLDCVTMFLSNRLLGLPNPDGEKVAEVGRSVAAELLAILGDPEPTEVHAKDGGATRASAAPEDTLIVVTNEVGMGVVPPFPLGRWFRDAQGTLNQALTARADWVVMVVSGIPLKLKG